MNAALLESAARIDFGPSLPDKSPVTAAQIAREILSLPQDAQSVVLNFIAALQPKVLNSKPVRATGKTKRMPLSKEPFIGMRRDRERSRG